MASITTRAGKGSPLTNAELDANFTSLNTDIGTRLLASSNLGDLANAATARTNLGVAIGSNVQAWDADLDAIAALAGTSGILKKTAANTWALDTNTYLTANQSITVSGDASGSGATAITLTLANTGVTAGQYGSATAIPVVTVDAKGRLTAVSTTAVSIPSGALTFTGDVTGSGTTGSSTSLTLANSGVTAGTYTKVTVDAKGRVTVGASLASADLPTYTGSLSSSQVTTALGYTPYNSTNPSGYISGITSSMVTTALGYTPLSNATSYLPLAGGTLSGLLQISNQAAINTTTPGTANYGLHFTGQLTSDYATGITWNGGTGATGAQAGIYVQGSGSYGTRMYLATTDSYATGARTAISISESGVVNVVRNALQQGGNQVLHAGNFTSYALSIGGGTITSTTDQCLTINRASGWNYMAFSLGGTRKSYFGLDSSGNPVWGADSGTPAIGGNLVINGYTALHANNYSSYALPLSGGTMTGALYQSTTDNSSKLTFNTPGAYYVGLAGNVSNGLSLVQYNSSAGAAGNAVASYALLHAGNYSSYALPLSGGTLSGNLIFSLGSSPSIKSDYALQFLTLSNGAVQSKFGGIQVSDSYSGSIPYNGILFGTDTTLERNTNSYGSLYVSGARNGYCGLMFGTGYGAGGWMTNGNTTGFYMHGYGWKYYHENGAFYIFSGANGGGTQYTALHSGNYSSYALPLSGGTLSGLLVSKLNEAAFGSANDTTVSIRGGTSAPAAMSFHRPGIYAINFGLDTDNQLKVGGWSMGGSYVILHSNNYTSYSPSLTGSGASGTWGINVTGSAGYATYLSGANAYTNGSDGWWRSNGNAGWYNASYAVGIYATEAGNVRTYNGSNFIAAGNVTAYSDERLKTNWRDLPGDFVDRLAGVKNGVYDRTDTEFAKTQVGVSAQSLRDVMPEAILEDSEGILSVAYGNAALASAVELAKRVVEQEERIKRLESLIETLIGEPK